MQRLVVLENGLGFLLSDFNDKALASGLITDLLFLLMLLLQIRIESVIAHARVPVIKFIHTSRVGGRKTPCDLVLGGLHGGRFQRYAPPPCCRCRCLRLNIFCI